MYSRPLQSVTNPNKENEAVIRSRIARIVQEEE
jgi:hypothetical protein